MIKRGADSKSNKIRSFLHSAFNYALKHDNDPAHLANDNATFSKFGLTTNPVTPIPKQTHAEKQGDHYLEFNEVYTLLYDMKYRFEDLKMDEQTRDIIQLCFYLGGQRPYEICNLRKTDVNFEEKTATVPDHIFKANRHHVIALTKESIEIFAKYLTKHSSPYFFHKTSNLYEPKPTNTIAQAVDRYRKKTEIRHFVPRDFRRTFKTLAGKLSISKENRDRIQGHALNDVSSKHYDRYDYLIEKRKVMEIWCDNLTKGILSERELALSVTKQPNQI